MPALIASRYPISGSGPLRHSVFLAYVGDQYSTVMFNDNNVYVGHFDIYIKMDSANNTVHGAIQSK